MKPTTVTHIGSTRFGAVFDWANLHDTLEGKAVFTIGCVTQPDGELFSVLPQDEAAFLKAQLDQLHLRKIDESQEIFVLNHTDYLGSSTLHELCYAYNQQKTIRWLEDWSMYCPRCRVEGPTSVHFFHQVMSLRELTSLLEAAHDNPDILSYLPGQLISWYGQIVPVIALANGMIALQVDPPCQHCGSAAGTYYAIWNLDDSFLVLLPPDGSPFDLVDLCDADQRSQQLRCSSCASLPEKLVKIMIRKADSCVHSTEVVAPMSQIPELLRPFLSVIAGDEFESLVLRVGLTQYTVSVPLPVSLMA